MGSCYLWHSEGPTARNLAVLAAFGALADATAMQWVLGGDFNMDPERLEQTGAIDKLKGVIVRPSEGTCKVPKREASTRDYFIVSRRLARTEHATVEKDLAMRARCSPHFPVSCWLGKRAPAYKVMQLAKIQRWPLDIPQGCAAAPIEWPSGPDLAGDATQEVVDAHWRSTAKTYESNLNR